jgi:glutaminase
MAVENCILPDNDEAGAASVVGAGSLSSDCSPIFSALQEIYAKYQNDYTGKLANYIPQLAKVDPHLFGIALVSADGQMYEVGDSRHLFTIQSISKPLVYALALEDHGVDTS